MPKFCSEEIERKLFICSPCTEEQIQQSLTDLSVLFRDTVTAELDSIANVESVFLKLFKELKEKEKKAVCFVKKQFQEKKFLIEQEKALLDEVIKAKTAEKKTKIEEKTALGGKEPEKVPEKDANIGAAVLWKPKKILGKWNPELNLKLIFVCSALKDLEVSKFISPHVSPRKCKIVFSDDFGDWKSFDVIAQNEDEHIVSETETSSLFQIEISPRKSEDKILFITHQNGFHSFKYYLEPDSKFGVHRNPTLKVTCKDAIVESFEAPTFHASTLKAQLKLDFPAQKMGVTSARILILDFNRTLHVYSHDQKFVKKIHETKVIDFCVSSDNHTFWVVGILDVLVDLSLRYEIYDTLGESLGKNRLPRVSILKEIQWIAASSTMIYIAEKDNPSVIAYSHVSGTAGEFVLQTPAKFSPENNAAYILQEGKISCLPLKVNLFQKFEFLSQEGPTVHRQYQISQLYQNFLLLGGRTKLKRWIEVYHFQENKTPSLTAKISEQDPEYFLDLGLWQGTIFALTSSTVNVYQ